MECTVDFHHIRSSPSQHKDRSYELQEKVNVFCDFSCFSGIISDVLAERMYTIAFKLAVEANELSLSK